MYTFSYQLCVFYDAFIKQFGFFIDRLFIAIMGFTRNFRVYSLETHFSHKRTRLLWRETPAIPWNDKWQADIKQKRKKK